MREVICGPFHSGHRERWTAEFRDKVRAGQAHTLLYLVPTRGLAGVVRDQILQDIPGIAGEPVLTLFEVVEQILDGSDRSYIRLDSLAAERLTAKVMSRLSVQWKSEPLAHWTHSPGVVAAFRRHIGELKRARIEPETFRAQAVHLAGSPDEETVHVLAAVYAAYQEALHAGEHLLLDTEETYAEAARLLQNQGLQGIYPGVEQIYIDYFTDFQPHQLAVVLPLLQVEHVQVYLPYQIERWSWLEGIAAQMRETIDRLFQEKLQVRYEDMETVPTGLAEDIRLIQSRLFAPHPEPLDAAPNVNVFAARTAEKEWLWAAKRIKELHGQGTPLTDIAILTTRELRLGSTAQRVLEQEGLPVQQAVMISADQVPWVRDLLALYTLADDEWHRDLLQQLASADWLLGEHQMRGRETLPQRLAKQFGVVQGYESWQQRVQEALARTTDEQEREELHAFLQWLQMLWEKTERIPQHAAGVDHIEAMRQLLPGAELYQQLVMQHRAGGGYTIDYLQRDLRGRDAVANVLRSLEDTERVLGGADSYTRREFVQLIQNHLAAEEITIKRGNRAGVALLNPSAARGLTFAHVFFVGLNEGEWPVPAATPWLLREGVRDLLQQQIALPAAQIQADQEKLFFLMGLHTARQGIWASYVSASKQDLPSRFLDALLELCPAPEQAPHDDYLGGSDLFPAHLHELSNRREARDWLAAQLAMGRLTEEALWLVEQEHWNAVLSQAASELGRAEQSGASRYDGVLSDPAIQDELAARYSKSAVYSVSLFNRYGECGYKFYLSRVLHLEADQEEEEELSALEKGNLYHKVLHRLYRQLTSETKITTDRITAMRAEIAPIFEAEWNRAQRGRQTQVGVRQILEKERLLRRLHDWFDGEAQAWLEQGIDLVPRYLEWVFGMKSDPAHHDPHSQAAPITVGGLQFRGQIDRIDATADGHFFLVDYKTRSLKSIPKDIENGLDFQLPVYLRAVEQALFAEGSAIGAAYYSIEKVDRKTSVLVKEQYLDDLGMGKKRTKFDAESWDALLAHTEQTIEQYRVQMTEGQFPVLPHDQDKCQYCDYRRICRFDQLRALSQTAAQETATSEGGDLND